MKKYSPKKSFFFYAVIISIFLEIGTALEQDLVHMIVLNLIWLSFVIYMLSIVVLEVRKKGTK